MASVGDAIYWIKSKIPGRPLVFSNLLLAEVSQLPLYGNLSVYSDLGVFPTSKSKQQRPSLS